MAAESARRAICGYLFVGMHRDEFMREPIMLTALKKADQLLESG